MKFTVLGGPNDGDTVDFDVEPNHVAILKGSYAKGHCANLVKYTNGKERWCVMSLELNRWMKTSFHFQEGVDDDSA